MSDGLSKEVVTAAIEELRSFQVDAYRDNPTGELKQVADWVRDRIGYVIVLLRYGDAG